MLCNKVREKIAERFGADSAYPPGEETAAHLAACELCREEQEQVLLAEAALRLLGEKQPAPDLAADLSRRLDREKVYRGRRALKPALWAATGAAALLLAGGLILLRPAGPVAEKANPSRAVAAPENPAAKPIFPAVPREAAAMLPPKVNRAAVPAITPKPARAAALPKIARPKAMAAPAVAPAQLVEVEDHRAPENIVLLVDSPQPKQSSSYLIELSRTDGSKSVRGGSIERDQAGRPLTVQIISWDTPPEKGKVEGG
jgi:hypothetical protein